MPLFRGATAGPESTGPLAPFRRGAVAVAMVAVASLLSVTAACGVGRTGDNTSEPTTGPVPPELGADECPDEGFRIVVSGFDAAMGVRAAGIEMTNCGDASIEVNGYPVVEVLHDGAPVNVEVRPGSDELEDPGPSRVVVAPGESVSAGMLWRHRVESVDPDDIVDATAIAVSYADNAPLQIVEPEYSIDLGTTRILEVTAWR